MQIFGIDKGISLWRTVWEHTSANPWTIPPQYSHTCPMLIAMDCWMLCHELSLFVSRRLLYTTTLNIIHLCISLISITINELNLSNWSIFGCCDQWRPFSSHATFRPFENFPSLSTIDAFHFNFWSQYQYVEPLDWFLRLKVYPNLASLNVNGPLRCFVYVDAILLSQQIKWNEVLLRKSAEFYLWTFCINDNFFCMWNNRIFLTSW
jgi:hypothetical protein